MIVVTGATGNVGRSLVTQLVAGGRAVRALTRSPERAGLPEGAEVVRADLAHLTETDTAALFEGARAVFLNLGAIGGGLGAAADTTARLLTAARQSGATRAVMLSSGIIQDGADTTHPIHVHHAEHERAVRDSGLEWTMLRPNAFAANALQWAPQIRTGDTVRGPYANAVTAPIHEADIAAVALRALVQDGHAGAAYRLTGPEAVTTVGQIQAIGTALGRDLTFTEVPAEEVGPELFPHVPPEMLTALLDGFAQTVGTPPEITDTVQRVTGTPARTFTGWAQDHASDFR